MGSQRVGHDWASNNFTFFHVLYTHTYRALLVAQMVKNSPAMRETWIWSLGWEEPMKKGTAIHSSILAWRIPWTKEPGRVQFMGSQRVGHDWATFTYIYIYAYIFVQHAISLVCSGITLIPASSLSHRVARWWERLAWEWSLSRADVPAGRVSSDLMTLPAVITKRTTS